MYILGTRWQSISKGHVQKWRNHAKFWLEEWKGSLKIIMYKDFVSDIQNSLHDLLYYLGFPFDEQNLHRHCCVLQHPINEAIKRERSVIDDYRVCTTTMAVLLSLSPLSSSTQSTQSTCMLTFDIYSMDIYSMGKIMVSCYSLKHRLVGGLVGSESPGLTTLRIPSLLNGIHINDVDRCVKDNPCIVLL